MQARQVHKSILLKNLSHAVQNGVHVPVSANFNHPSSEV